MTLFPKVLALGAAATTYWLMRESWDADINAQQVASLEQDARYADLQDTWGDYAGDDAVTDLVHRKQHFLRFGPMGLFLAWRQQSLAMSNYINGVILPNLIPIGLTGAALWAGFGKEAQAAVRYTRQAIDKYLPNVQWGSPFVALGRGIKNVAKGGIDLAVQGVIGGAKLVGKGGWASAALLSVAGILLYRFGQVESGQAQRDLFWPSSRN